MEWMSGAIGIGGLLVAALSVYLTYRSRTSSYRERLYETQLEAVSSVHAAFVDYYSIAQDFITSQGLRLNEDGRVLFREFIFENAEPFYKARQKWSLFLPTNVNDSLSADASILNAISAPPSVANQYPSNLVNSHDPGGELSKAYVVVVSEMRKCLGTDPLSAETLRLIGEKSSKGK